MKNQLHPERLTLKNVSSIAALASFLIILQLLARETMPVALQWAAGLSVFSLPFTATGVFATQSRLRRYKNAYKVMVTFGGTVASMGLVIAIYHFGQNTAYGFAVAMSITHIVFNRFADDADLTAATLIPHRRLRGTNGVQRKR